MGGHMCGACSSARLERIPDKDEADGSSPSRPTRRLTLLVDPLGQLRRCPGYLSGGPSPPDPRDRGCCLGGGACWTPRSGLGLRVAVGGPPDPRDRGLGLGFASCGGTAPGAPCAADAAC